MPLAASIASAPHPSPVPQSVLGCEVIGRLGYGAGSTIYAVCQPRCNELFALKHVVCQCGRDRRLIDQLTNEYQVGQRIKAPNLRRSIELRTRRDWLGRVCQAALLLELADGTPLHEQLPYTIDALTDCFIQVATALQSLHAMGFVHCDLKPNNVLLNAAGQVKVIDLGQACRLGTAKPRIQGTPDFIAPEQVRCQPVTPRTDVFNFGATLYWCLTGQNLPTLYRLRRGQNSFLVDERFTPPHELNPTIPANLSQFVMECIRTNPAHRPDDAHELVRRLEVIQFTLHRAAILPLRQASPSPGGADVGPAGDAASAADNV